MPGSSSGFTLIELVIALAIVAILAAVGYPSYQDAVQKSRRADARAVLLQAQQMMERRYTENMTAGYAGITLPTSLQHSPVDGTTKYYNISLTGATQTTYTLSAAPTGSQYSDPCGTLSITNAGVKTAAKSIDYCWR